MTAIDELTAAVHRALARHVSYMTTGEYNRLVDAILEAAEKYAAAEYANIADRRAVLEAAGVERADQATHLAQSGNPFRSACGFRMVNPSITSSRLHVTCGACKRTRAWKEGL